MVIDHVGVIFFSNEVLFRIIGRIAFPLYSWFLVQGYTYTRNQKRYMLRLLSLACISQVPYTLALQQWEFNVIFTLLLSLIGIYFMDYIVDQRWKTCLIIGLATLAATVPMDYGLYGFLLIFIIRYTQGLKLISLHMLINMVYFFTSGQDNGIQTMSILGTALIAYPVSFSSRTVPKWIYHSFYPVHLTILFFLAYLLN